MAIPSIKLDIQKLEPGARIRLIELDMSSFDGEILRWHNYKVDYTQEELLAAQANGTTLTGKPIAWQGNDYYAWPYQLSGIQMDGTGAAAQPTLSVANLDSTISSLCLQYQDLAQAKVIIHTTFEHYLDGRTDADPEQEFVQIWYVDYKSSDNNLSVSWVLSNPAEIGGKMIPARQIQPICHWLLKDQYRGPDCQYTGTNYFDIDGNPVDDPSEDVCSGLTETGCKPRFGATNPLSFGGFISSADLN